MKEEDDLDPAFRSRLRQTLVETAQSSRSSRTSRGFAVAAFAAATLVAGGIGFGFLHTPPTAPESGAIEIRSIDVLCSDGLAIAMPETGGAPQWQGTAITLIVGAEDAAPRIIDSCAELWRDGTLLGVELQSAGGAQGGALSATRDPALSLCQSARGETIVLPVSGCALVGLEEWQDVDQS